MHIAREVGRGVPESAVGRRGRRPVEGFGIVFFQEIGNDVFEQPQVVRFGLGIVGDAPAFPGGFDLIVAAPHSQGSVVAQAQDVVDDFGADGGFEFRGQQIGRAGEHEVLPHDQAVLVAPVIEAFVRIPAATPDADEVVVGGFAGFQQSTGALFGHARDDLVFRDIVGAHGEYLGAVVDEAELVAPLVFVLGYGQRTQADAALQGVHRAAVTQEFDAAGIEGLAAEAAHPPQLGMFDDDLRLTVFQFRRIRLPVRRSDRPACGQGILRPSVDICLAGEPDDAVFVALGVIDAVDAAGGIPLQGHGTPDAQVGQLGTPVPAEHTVRLAQVRISGHGRIHAPERPLFLHLGDVPGGGVDLHAQQVIRFAQDIPDLVRPGAVHVIRMSKKVTVQIDLGQSIDAFKAQNGLVRGQDTARRVKTGFKSCVPVRHACGDPFVFADVWIGDFTGPDQRFVQRAGHGAGITPAAVDHCPVFVE